MPIRGLLLAFGAVGMISLGMALRGVPSTFPSSPATFTSSPAYVETGSLRLALAWREAVRKQLRRVGGSMLGPGWR